MIARAKERLIWSKGLVWICIIICALLLDTDAIAYTTELKCGDDLYYTRTDQGFRIYGSGTMENYKLVPHYVEVRVKNGMTFYYDLVQDGWTSTSPFTDGGVIAIEKDATSIGSYAFYGAHISSISLPSTLASISETAFENCSADGIIALPDNIRSISKNANSKSPLDFISADPDSRTAKTLSDSGIGFFARDDMGNTPDYALRYGKTKYMEMQPPVALAKYLNVPNVSIPDTIYRIDSRAFENNTAVEYISIPENITEIVYRAFIGCSNLKKILLPNTLQTIGGEVFSDCS